MVLFRESLTPSWQFHIALLVLLPMGFGAVAPLSMIGGYVAAVVLYSVSLVIFVLRAPRIVVTDDTLTAGRATIPRSVLGTATVIDENARQAAISDARTWKLIRAWIPTGVLIQINDPEDPTPSWYLSTRNPDRLVEVLSGS